MKRWLQVLMTLVIALVLTAAIGRNGAAEIAFSPPSPISPLPIYLPMIDGGEKILQVYLPLVWR
jgi:hypothetical protein